MKSQKVVPAKQMQVRVTFYTSHNPQSVLMILKNDTALEQITEKAKELFNSDEYCLYYGDMNGPIYEFTDSEQVMEKVRITAFSRTPQLFVRLENRSKYCCLRKSPSKSSAALKRIEHNQEVAMKCIRKLQKDFDRVNNGGKANESFEEPEFRELRPVLHSATCDECQQDILGHRYKCLVCPDYDLCEACEKKSMHFEHAMLRIVSPSKTTIPEYVTRAAPEAVFPMYMRKSPSAEIIDKSKVPGDVFIKILDTLASNVSDKVDVVGKSFMDLADGHQVRQEKKREEPMPVQSVTSAEAKCLNSLITSQLRNAEIRKQNAYSRAAEKLKTTHRASDKDVFKRRDHGVKRHNDLGSSWPTVREMFQEHLEQPAAELSKVPKVAPTAPPKEVAVPKIPTPVVSRTNSLDMELRSLTSSFESLISEFERIGQVDVGEDQPAVHPLQAVLVPKTETATTAAARPMDLETEKIINRLLEMGFDYDDVHEKVAKYGADLQKILASLIN